MFYSVFVLGKKGPLAKVWLAAHWDKKITKAQIMETNVAESVDAILQPKVKLSLRTQSHLLLGICRIHSRKAQYLLQDCQDAAFKIKSAFRPDAVDLPDGKTEASIAAITLPEMLDFVSDFDLVTEPPVHIDQPLTAANIRSITMVEDLSSIHIDDPLMHEVRDWGDLSSVRGAASSDLSLHPSHSGTKSKEGNLLDIYDRPIDDDGFAGTADGDVDDMFALPVPPEAQEQLQREREEAEAQKKREADGERPHSRMSADSDYSAPASMAPSGGPSTPGSVPPHDPAPDDGDENFDMFAPRNAEATGNGPAAGGDVLPNSMVLDPIEGAAGFERKKKRRKKLGIIIDEVKTLSGEEMKSQLSDTTDIVTSLELAPPSKKLMHWKRTGGSEKLFALPERSLPSRILSRYYSRNLITSRIEKEEEMEVFMTNGDASMQQMPQMPDMDDLQLEQMAPPASPRKAGLRPLKPRDKLEKERSPTKKRRTHDKENQSSQPPKSPRPPRSPSRADRAAARESEQGRFQKDESSLQFFDKSGRKTLDFQQEEQEDYGDSYDQPMSVGPAEEMMPNETAEQFEERVRNKRSNVLLRYLSNQLEDEDDGVTLSIIVANNNRKQVAQKFYSLLVLKKQQAIELYQDAEEEYGEITVTRGVRYEEALQSCA